MLMMKISKQVLGKEHRAHCQACRAFTHQEQGRRKEAEELPVLVMKISLGSMGTLASAYENQGRCKEVLQEMKIRWVTSK